VNIQSLAKSNTFVNLLGFGVVSICGVLINLLVAKNYEVAVVGLFSYFYSLLIICSQFSTFGLHYSALKYLSEDDIDLDKKLTSGLAIAIVSGIFCLFIFLGFAYFFSKLPRSTEYLICAAVGILIFSINKYFLFCLNGLHWLRAFAVFNTLRYVFSIVWLLLGTYFLSIEQVDLFLCSLVLIPELVLLVVLIFKLSKYIHFGRISFPYVKNYFVFGFKGMWTGALTEVNTKVDVLFITHFLGAGSAGIYSIPTMIFEGASQLPSVFRNILNPKISRLYRLNDLMELKRQIVISAKMSLIFVPVLCVVSGALFPIYVRYFVGIEAYMDGWASTIILLSGMILSAALLPVQMFLIQTGEPGKQSLFLFAAVLLNIVLNVALVPSMGVAGAALATAITTVASSLLNFFIVRSKINQREKLLFAGVSSV